MLFIFDINKIYFRIKMQFIQNISWIIYVSPWLSQGPLLGENLLKEPFFSGFVVES